jgi:hypothetical protein
MIMMVATAHASLSAAAAAEPAAAGADRRTAAAVMALARCQAASRRVKLPLTRPA